MAEKSAGTILIVDDVLMNVKLLRMILQKAGYKTQECGLGNEAFRMTASLQPDLVLLDVQLPDVNGYDVCRRLKTMPGIADIPIIFITGSTGPGEAVLGFEAGGVDFITKPFNAEELLARVNTHLELRRSRLRLQELLSTKDKVFSIIAHDLKGPVGAMASILQADYFAPESCGKEENQKVFSMLRSTAQNSYQLLENLLDWARSQRGHWKSTPVLVDLRSFIPELQGLYEFKLNQKNLVLKADLGSEPQVFADRKMLMTVVRNLVGNSIKFTPKSGEISLEYRAWGERGEIRIRDTGTGMPAEVLEGLMNSAIVSSTQGTEGETGSGLGLILCRELMEKMQGTLTLDSKPGEGTTVYLNLPLLPEIK